MDIPESAQKSMLDTVRAVRRRIKVMHSELDEYMKELDQIIVKHCKHTMEPDFTSYEPCWRSSEVCTKCGYQNRFLS